MAAQQEGGILVYFRRRPWRGTDLLLHKASETCRNAFGVICSDERPTACRQNSTAVKGATWERESLGMQTNNVHV